MSMEEKTTEDNIKAIQSENARQVAKRRTFAIISHPDAGKTTLTEKMLLYSGMVRTAGVVRARKGSKNASSDWMAMEQERGISITASAMQFEYKNATINLLDTPGHQDFSEDTYRTLTAADSAIMVIDAAKGVEAQTKKLFTVCKLRGIPILTFINKLDLPTKDFFDLLHEVEEVLGIAACPLNWPIGSGKDFVGLVECQREKQLVHIYKKKGDGGAHRADEQQTLWADFRANPSFDSETIKQTDDALDLLAGAGNRFCQQEFMAGKVTPVFFGSALTNFGVETFFDNFVALAPSPQAVSCGSQNNGLRIIDPLDGLFSAFVFKMQTNMNPRHRDSMAYLRVVSGVFERDLVVKHHRSGKQVRLSRSYAVNAADRETIDRGFAGDIIGVINPGVFAIGDTISTGSGDFNFPPMPQFPPEVIAQLRVKDVLKKKAFEKGLESLSVEGAVRLLRSYDIPANPPFVAAVGNLQFEVLQYRLADEYGVETILELQPYRLSAWLQGNPKTLKKPRGACLVLDSHDRVVVLFSSEWEKNYLLETNPEHRLIDFI